jgi:hypothetical protein
MWEKADQLRPLAGLGVPLVIVLANPLGADVILDGQHVIAGMFGNPGFSIPIDPTIGGRAEGIDSYGASRTTASSAPLSSRTEGSSTGRTVTRTCRLCSW